MKLLKIGLLSLTLVAISGCQKEAVDNIVTGDDMGGAKAARPRSYTLVRDETNGPSCPSPASNCTKITLLRANDDHGVGVVLEAISTGDQGNIVVAFRNERRNLLNVMDEADIDAVIDRSYTAEAETGHDGTHYVILSSSSKVEVAYPFKYE